MDLPTLFFPPRKNGIIFQSVTGIVLAAACGSCVVLAIHARADLSFLVYLVLSLALFIPLPWIIYRIYALAGASYRMERDGLHLHWGLRAEDIPLMEIEWVRPASELAAVVPAGPGRRGGALPLPLLRWPGALLGTRTAEGLGTIEYLASGAENLLLVAIPHKIYAISPADPAGFTRTFRRMMEMGSLAQAQPKSVYPTVIFTRLWDDPYARALLGGGLALVVLLLGWVALLITSHPQIPLGFSPSGTPLDPSSGERLLLLPVLNALAYLADAVAGLFFYRRQSLRPVAYLLWSSGVVCGVALLLGVVNIIKG